MSSEARARRVEKPEVLEDEESEEEERPGRRRDSDSEDEDELMDDAEIEKRRAYIRQRALEKQEDELLVKEDEKDSGSEESESEYEEYTDSEEEARPRLKPVFVFKHERVTIKEKEQLDTKEKQVEDVEKQRREERRKETLKVIEEEIQNDKTAIKGDAIAERQKLEDVNTDDENEEAEYEAWKIRELKRVKRDREEREALEREKMEIERLHGLTEEERRLEMKLKPKQIINKAAKGKYKFLQKYYHRGVFYLDHEEDVLKRDYSSPTLEDHFDKTILPKVMQVKNFGRSGRTKYTHLVDQDTTNFESPWVAETTQNLKFYASQAAGVRQTFDKPSTKKRKMDAE
jgi:microfibrillar-associated protein 1